jgi:hypothetical protein
MIVLSFMGGRTIVFSTVRITIFQSSFKSLFKTVFSQDCAYIVNEPSRRSINGRRTSSASVEPGFAWGPVLLILNNLSPSSRTLCDITDLRLEGMKKM